jgi:hypothetical protein
MSRHIITRLSIVSFITLLVIPFLYWKARAQVENLHTDVEYTLGKVIFFKAYVQSVTPVKAAVIYFQAENDTHTNVGLAEVHSLGNGSFAMGYIHNLSDYAIRPFSSVTFHWELTLRDGTVYVSPDERFSYLDNRFDWKTMQKTVSGDKKLVIHWYQGDVQFAQNVLDVADTARKRIQELLLLPMPGKLDIYVYADPETMQAALNPSSASWVAGHADPDLRMILVTLPEGPEQRLLVEQRIPHELMHILLYQANPLGYAHLPAWLNEGLASNVELDPNPDYRILLEDAAKKKSLIPLPQLCDSFPGEPYSALLSYAEATSFVRYLHDSYGVSGMQALTTAYGNGLDCERGAEQALGKSLTQLGHNWEREHLSQNGAYKAFLNMLPWIILLLAVLTAPLVLVLLHLRSLNSSATLEKQSG